MVRQPKAADAIGRLASKLRTYLRPQVLVLDGVGYLPLSRDEANLVFQTISKRYQKGSIVLTCNRAFSEWGSVFGDESPGHRYLGPPRAPLRGHRDQRAQRPAQTPPRRRRGHRQQRHRLPLPLATSGMRSLLPNQAPRRPGPPSPTRAGALTSKTSPRFPVPTSARQGVRRHRPPDTICDQRVTIRHEPGAQARNSQRLRAVVVSQHSPRML